MLDELFNIIESRKIALPEHSYTRQLMEAGENRILRKIGEESVEVILAAKSEGDQRIIEEAADLMYHLLVLLSYRNLTLDQVKTELAERHQAKPE